MIIQCDKIEHIIYNQSEIVLWLQVNSKYLNKKKFSVPYAPLNIFGFLYGEFLCLVITSHFVFKKLEICSKVKWILKLIFRVYFYRSKEEKELILIYTSECPTVKNELDSFR